ncbi:MAG: discoidin domain-containing protein [Verrucomicrobiales bacterium]
MHSRINLLVTCLALTIGIAAATPFDQALYDEKARTYSPEESMAMMELQEGYRVELVAAEPMVDEPAAIAFDGDGKLYVAELNSYMQEIDGKDQLEPVCRVVLLEDTDDDGRMDKRTVFADGLVMPRMIQPIDDRVLIRETNTFDLYCYRDTDGDGMADEKKLVYEGGPRGGNLEHQPSGLDWNIDNWMYVTYTNKRYRWMGDHVIAEDIPHGTGQWGVTHDDVGRNFFSAAGGENPAMNFQRPHVYGQISLPGEQAPGFREVFPVVHIPDVQGGKGRFRADSLTLNAFTGCAGQHIFRGDRLPADFYGDYIIPEPVGRLVRRAKVTNENGRIVVSNATPGTEFLRSRDANFRPINAKTGPDGCLYLCDMYRGIIQEGNWVRPGSYLREVVENHGLDKNIHRGRIYRIVHESTQRGSKPQMLKAPTEELVGHLSHPNGWWRDTAQKLIVVRQDTSVISQLKELAKHGTNPLGRLHALWTLDGLNTFDEELIVAALSDPDARVRAAAVRLCEPELTRGNMALLERLKIVENDPDIDVAIQWVLSLGRSGVDGGPELVAATQSRHSGNEALARITDIGRAQLEDAKRRRERSKFLAAGEQNFQTICIACHGPDGKGTPAPGLGDVTLGAPLAGSPRLLGRKDIPIRIVLKGMHGDLDGKAYPGPMLPLETYDDEWLASVLTFLRSSWGNKAPGISKEDVASVRASIADRKEMYHSSEILAMTPVSPREMRKWKFSASHNGKGCRRAIDGNARTRWDTGAVQQPGMWFAFDMGDPREVTSITLHCESSPDDYPRSYAVEVSDDGEHWKEIVANTQNSKEPATDILLPPTKTRHVRINQNGKADGKFWSIHQLEVFATTGT